MKKVGVGLLLLIGFHSFSQDLLSQQKAERLMNEGVMLMMRKHYGPARQNFESLLQLNAIATGTRSDAQYYAAFCALNLFQGNAEKLIEDFIEQNPKHPKAALANYELANFYYTEKNYKKASLNYKKVEWSALTIEEHNSGRFRWAYALFNQRQLAEALDQFNFVKSLGGQYGPASSYYAGFIEYSQGDYANALTDLQRAGQNEAYAKVVPYLIANVYYRQQQYDELIRYNASLEKAEDISNAEEINLLVAEAYFKKGDYTKALPAYQNYLTGKEDKTEKAILLRAGYSAYITGNENAAVGYLKNSFADNDSVGFYSAYYLGAIYLKRNQKPMAQASFDIARKYRGDDRLVEESTFLYSKVSYELGKSELAITELEKLLARFPNSQHNGEIRELLSQAYVNANNYNKAIEYIEALPRRGPAVDRAYQKATLLKGQELFNKESYEDAIRLFEKSLSTASDADLTAEANFWCGEALSVLKSYEKASAYYLNVVASAKPELLVKARYGLGYVYFNEKDYDRALFNFKDFINKSSKNESNVADATIRMADCQFVLKQYPDALVSYKRAIASKPADEDYARLQYATILGIQSKYSEATAEFDYLIKQFPASAYLEEARFNRAQLDFEQGKYASAVSNYTAVIASSSSSKFTPYALSKRAASYYNLKDYNKTADDYIAILQKYAAHPISNDVLLPLQEALNLAGRSAEFQNYLSSYKTSNPDAKGIESVEFEAAKGLYFNQEYAKAIVGLSAFVNTYPQSIKLTEAKYYQAESYYRLKDWSKALEVYLAIYPEKTFAFASKVVGRLAEIEFKNGRYENAIPYFRLLNQAASNKKEQYNGWSGLMESHYYSAQYDSSSHYANIILEKGNINAGAQNKASLYLGKCSMAKGDYETAKDEFLSTLNSARDEYGAEAKYLLGEIFYLNKDYKQCYETLVGLTSDFAAYPDWVGKAFLLLADSYLMQGDRYQAKATLKSLQEFPLEAIKQMAADRLKKLDEEDLKKMPVKSDSTENEKR